MFVARLLQNDGLELFVRQGRPRDAQHLRHFLADGLVRLGRVTKPSVELFAPLGILRPVALFDHCVAPDHELTQRPAVMGEEEDCGC